MLVLLSSSFSQAENAPAAAPATVERAEIAGAAAFLETDDIMPHAFANELRGSASVRFSAGAAAVESYVLEWADEELSHSFDVLRRATGHSFGVRGTVDLGRGVQGFAGGRADSQPADPASGRSARYDVRELEAGIGWKLSSSLRAKALYGYRSGQTDEFGRPREQHRVKLEIGHNFSDWLRVKAAFLSRIHDSSTLPSEKGRYLACIGFEAKY